MQRERERSGSCSRILLLRRKFVGIRWEMLSTISKTDINSSKIVYCRQKRLFAFVAIDIFFLLWYNYNTNNNR